MGNPEPAANMENRSPELCINNLKITIQKNRSRDCLVNGVTLMLVPRTPLSLIGETGCGKSLIAQAILKTLPPEMMITGEILYRDQNLLDLSPTRMRSLWGRKIFLFPQEPSAAFNPVRRSGNQVSEIFQFVRPTQEKPAPWKRLFREVGLLPEDGRKYPWQLSGGMGQRLMTAMTLAEPAPLIVADEPTKGLDTPVKTLTVELLRQMVAHGKSLFVITHDLDLPRQMGGEIAVMYAGMIMEQGAVETVLETPRHPYTRALLAALPEKGLHPIPRQVNGNEFLGGCPFSPRCTEALPLCFFKIPEERRIHYENRHIRCHCCHTD